MCGSTPLKRLSSELRQEDQLLHVPIDFPSCLVSDELGRPTGWNGANRPVEDWGKLLGDSAAVTAMHDRLLHHGQMWATELEHQVAGGTMSTTPKTSRKATT